MSGQMTRDAALKRIAVPELDEHFLEREFEYVAHKLDLTVEELRDIFSGNNKTIREYKNKRFFIGIASRVMSLLGLEKRLYK
jgi:formyltetrahydrofolate synthetase